MSTKVKFCGITSLQDAKKAIELGVDALGFVFYQKSKRYIEPHQAQDIIASLPPLITNIALFVNDDQATIQSILNQGFINLLQFHGDESPEFCESFNFPYIKALRVNSQSNISQLAQQYASAKALLLDTDHPGVYGGSGQVFNWELIPKQTQLPIILAGGLNPENVAAAIQQTHSYAVDVSSGIEQSPGRKDPAKMEAFMTAVRCADGKR